MLIQCNFLEDTTKDTLPLTSSFEALDDTGQIPNDEKKAASTFMPARMKWGVWPFVGRRQRWRRMLTASLLGRCVLAIFSGFALCSFVGGCCLLGLLYFGRSDPPEHYSSSGAPPRVQDVRAMQHERHGVAAMTAFLQQQVNRRQTLAAWWQLLSESSLLLNGIEWHGNNVDFTVSGSLSAVNELIANTRLLNGNPTLHLREFQPEHTARHLAVPFGVARLGMTLCDAPQQATSLSSGAEYAVGAANRPSAKVASAMLPLVSPNDECAPDDTSSNPQGRLKKHGAVTQPQELLDE